MRKDAHPDFVARQKQERFARVEAQARELFQRRLVHVPAPTDRQIDHISREAWRCALLFEQVREEEHAGEFPPADLEAAGL